MMRKESYGDNLSLCGVEEFNAYTVSYESLKQQTSYDVQCEFCDEIFKTRIANIKHNAAHIIIPLIKLTLHQCGECLFHFTSLKKLRAHVLKKGHKTSQLPDLESPTHTKLSIEDYDKLLHSIVEKQLLVSCHSSNGATSKCGTNVNREKIENSITKKQSVSALSPKEISKSINKKSLDNYIPTYVISSDSESESPERENGTTSNEQGYTELENGTTSNKQGYTELDIDTPGNFRFSSLKDLSSPRLTTPDYEPSMSNEQGNTELDIDTPGTFRFSSLKDLSSPRLTTPDYEPIRSRIAFEDDDLFEAEEILPDKPYQSNKTKNSCIIGTHVTNSVNKSKTGIEFVNGTYKSNQLNRHSDKNGHEVGNFNSVHYNDLVVDELCECRYCARSFSNRFELIKHECTHMRLKQTRHVLCCVCERYLAGNYRSLRKHMQDNHPRMLDWKLQVHKCDTCHLNYHNYSKHAQHYHLAYTCATCKNKYDKEQLQNHECIGPDTSIRPDCIGPDMSIRPDCIGPDMSIRPDCIGPDTSIRPDTFHSYKANIIKMCKICLVFCKNRQNIHYEVIGEHSEVGTIQSCDRCHNKCFGVNLVNRKVATREGTESFKRKKLPMSNKDRLKKMQNRLKMVNKMNKC